MTVAPADLRRGLDALAATMYGTMAGLVADSGFGLRNSIMNAVDRALEPLFALLGALPVAQLVAAELIDRIPIVLIVGLLTGFVLRYFRFRRLLAASMLVWPLCLLVMAARGGDEGRGFTDALVYLMQYGMLLLVILLVHVVLLRGGRPPVPSHEEKT
jgi:hypothetical protein